MTQPVIGITSTRQTVAVEPTLPADFSKVGICTTATGFDTAVFAPNTPVRFNSQDPVYLAALGTGYARDAVDAINDQLDGIQGSADIVMVIVPEGAGTAGSQAKLDATWANIIGASGPQTGLHALRAAPSETGMTPRLILGGYGYTAQRDGQDANPVIADLPAHLGALLAMAVVDLDDSSAQAAISARETISSERIIPIGVSARVFDTALAQTVTRPMSSRIVGLGIRSDNAAGGKPFDPWCNLPVYGIVGTNRAIPFSLLDGAVEGQVMLAADVGVVVRGEVGVDGAISDGGFVYMGTESCATGNIWSQFHQVRGADALLVEWLRITRQFLGRKVSADNVEAWVNSIRFNIRDHAAAGDILPQYKVDFLPARNSAQQVGLGSLTITPRIEPAPVFRVANIETMRYAPALDGLVQDIVARLAATA